MNEVLMEIRTKVKSHCKKPEKFLTVQNESFESLKTLTQVLYGCVKDAEEKEMGSIVAQTMPELIVKDFNEEQVWAGVVMQNQAVFRNLQQRLISKLAFRDQNILLGETRKRKSSRTEEENEEKTKRVRFEPSEKENLEDEEELSEGEDDDIDEESEVEEDDLSNILNDPDFQNMSDSDGDDLPLFDKDRSDEEESDEDEDEETEMKRTEVLKNKKKDLDTKADEYMKNVMSHLKKKSTGDAGAIENVEDGFFKFDEMDRFLESEDAAEERRRLREEKGLDNDDEEEDKDGIDLFDEIGGEDAEVDERATYKQYFSNIQQQSEQEELKEEKEEDERILQTDEKNDILADSSDEESNAGLKSTFEETRLRLKTKIKHLENEAVGDKPWQLTGEITGPARPENSLLQEHLDFDSVAKQAPIITEEVSRTLEDIIKRRLKDKAWDDVERKIKPVDDPYEYKKKLVLDHEKSKLSLAQIYEQEYLQQKSALENGQKVTSILDNDSVDVPKEVEEIKKNMKMLFAKLDTLTHFHYTPKNLNAEVKIIRNLPSIAIEDVAPVLESEANLLAPQEVVDERKGEMIGNSEKSETDKKRERRKKKLKQKSIANEKEKRKKLVDKINPGMGNKYSKKKMMQDLEKEEKQGNLMTIKERSKDKTVKSSSAFFNQLQEETLSALKKAPGKSKTDGRNNKSASHLKL